MFVAHNPLNRTGPRPTIQNRLPAGVSNPVGLNPMFGRPQWSYVNLQKSPVAGPDPRLAVGTGHSAMGNVLPGNAAQLPGYLTDTEYFPDMFDYSPVHRESNKITIPKTIDRGSNGRELVNTYEPHDFIPAQRFFNQNRSTLNWQVMSFPPNNRNLLAYQQAQRYNLHNVVAQARPLPSNSYFLGYQLDPSIAAKIGGQTGMGGNAL